MLQNRDKYAGHSDLPNNPRKSPALETLARPGESNNQASVSRIVDVGREVLPLSIDIVNSNPMHAVDIQTGRLRTPRRRIDTVNSRTAACRTGG